jgi:hypothetical protein
MVNEHFDKLSFQMGDEKNVKWVIFWIFISNIFWLINSNPNLV